MSHSMKIVDGEIEVCDTCVNSLGYPVGWTQTSHACICKGKSLRVYPGSDGLKHTDRCPVAFGNQREP